MNIYMIRHGRQRSALCNVNVELSEEGHRQAQLVGERLQSYGIDGLYASHLIRAVQTAGHISECLNLPVTEMDHIHEIDYGEWEGKSNAQLDEEYAAQRKAHADGIEDICYPGGESGATCYQRFAKGMQAIVEHAKAQGHKNIAIVTHGGAMRAFLCGEFGIPFAKRGILSHSLENGSITHLTYQPDKGYTLERFNDYAHLEPYDELLRKHFG